MSAKNKIKKRKVCYEYYNSSITTLPHPMIHIGGKYLEKYGFVIGDIIEVNLSYHQIVIKKTAAK